MGLRGRDVEGVGRLPAQSVRAAMQAARLPISTTLLDALVDRFVYDCSHLLTLHQPHLACSVYQLHLDLSQCLVVTVEPILIIQGKLSSK